MLVLVEDIKYKIVVFDEVYILFHLNINYCYCLLKFLNMGLYCLSFCLKAADLYPQRVLKELVRTQLYTPLDRGTTCFIQILHWLFFLRSYHYIWSKLVMFGIVHCMRYIWYTPCFGNWTYSHVNVIYEKSKILKFLVMILSHWKTGADTASKILR